MGGWRRARRLRLQQKQAQVHELSGTHWCRGWCRHVPRTKHTTAHKALTFGPLMLLRRDCALAVEQLPVRVLVLGQRAAAAAPVACQS